MDAHEATGQVQRYIDHNLKEFLSNLKEIEDTTILIFGDHGLSLT